MISFELSEEQSLLRAMLEQLAREKVRPWVDAHGADDAVSPALLQAVHQAQIVQAMFDDEGDDAHLRNCLVLEELGWADASLAALIAATLGYVHVIVKYGSAEQKAALRRASSGESFVGGAVLMAEPGFGAELNSMRTRAEAGSDGWTLNGLKACVPLSDGFDEFVVVARVDDGFGAFVVSKQMPGVTVRAGAPTLGLRPVALGELEFAGVSLPVAARLDGLDVQDLVSAARLANCAILTGLSRAVFEHITPYTKERVVHGAPLAQKQSVAFRLADMFIDIPAMRWMTWRGAVALDKGRCAARESRLAKLYCGPKAVAMADEGIQLMGGHGYMRENPVEGWFRNARTLSLLDGVVGL